MSYGQLGGMMSGLLGPNTFRRLRHYAAAGRSRCKKCRTMFNGRRPRRQAAAARARGRPGRARPLVPPRLHLRSFERAAYKTKTLERAGDAEGFDNCGRGPRGPAARIAA